VKSKPPPISSVLLVLIGRGTSEEAGENVGNKLLRFAVESSRGDVIWKLLAAGADPNGAYHDG